MVVRPVFVPMHHVVATMMGVIGWVVDLGRGHVVMTVSTDRRHRRHCQRRNHRKARQKPGKYVLGFLHHG